LQADSSQQSDAHKTPSEISDGPSSCKQARKHKKHVHHDVADAGSSDGKYDFNVSIEVFRTQSLVFENLNMCLCLESLS
jgi:hypothetical protein